MGRRNAAKKPVEAPRSGTNFAPPGQSSGRSKSKKNSLWAKYQSLLVRYPLWMNMLQSSIISGMGNATKQLVIDGTEPAALDWVSIGRSCFMAMFFVAPVITYWFRFIAVYNLSMVAAVLLDQFVFSPAFNLYFFHVWGCLTGALLVDYEAEDTDHLLHLRLKTDQFPSVFSYQPIWAAMTTSWMIWIPAAIIRQGQVPVHLRPVFNNVVSFGWQIMLASILSKNVKED